MGNDVRAVCSSRSHPNGPYFSAPSRTVARGERHARALNACAVRAGSLLVLISGLEPARSV